MAIHKSHQAEVNVPLNRVWTALQDKQLLCKAVPEAVKSIHEGEGGIVTLHLSPALAEKYGGSIKQKVENDPKEKKNFIEILEGAGKGTKFQSRKTVTCLKPGKSAGSTVVAWEVISDPVGEEEEEEAQAYGTLKRIEEYLNAHPDVYA